MKARKSVPFVTFTPKSAKAAVSHGVDLGTLQADFVASRRAVKSSGGVLARAQDAHDAARAAHLSTSEKLKAASRAVLADA